MNRRPWWQTATTTYAATIALLLPLLAITTAH